MTKKNQNSLKGRPYLGIMFDCCKVYVRIYLNRAGTHYNGRCPKCIRSIRFKVGESGTSARMWRAR